MNNHFVKADIAYKEGNFREAIARFNQVVEEEPQHIRALQGIAMSYYSLEDFDSAKQYIMRAISVDPRMATNRAVLASIFLKQKEYDLAEKEALLAVEYDKNFSPGYAMLSYIYQVKGNNQRAIEQKKNEIRHKPTWQSLCELGNLVLYLYKSVLVIVGGILSALGIIVPGSIGLLLIGIIFAFMLMVSAMSFSIGQKRYALFVLSAGVLLVIVKVIF